jgi:hypothetical protein
MDEDKGAERDKLFSVSNLKPFGINLLIRIDSNGVKI